MQVGSPMLVLLEYAENGSLQKFVQTHEVNLVQRLGMAYDCCDGLSYIHQKGFIHRDVAARNILLSSDFTCKIAGTRSFPEMSMQILVFPVRSTTLSCTSPTARSWPSGGAHQRST